MPEGGACFMECFCRTQTAILREKVPFAKACGNAQGEEGGLMTVETPMFISRITCRRSDYLPQARECLT